MKNEAREELANYLLNHSFLVGNYEETREKYFALLQNEEELQGLFRPLGYTILISRPLKTAQLVNLHGTGRVELRKYETILLLILQMLYLEKRQSLSVSEELVLVNVGEVETEYAKLNLPRRFDKKMLEDALRTFKRYNLAQPIDRLDNVDARIQILPSVMLAVTDQAINTVYERTRELLKQFGSTGREEDDADD